MPELPEVRALSERLDALLSGAVFRGATVLQFSALKTVDPRPDSLIGTSLDRVGRRGKFLVWEFGGPRILVHLSQGGRLDVEDPPKRTRPKGAIARFDFEDRPSALLKEFGTERKAGWWVLASGDEGPLAKLGPDPYSDEFATLILAGAEGRRVHTLLRDQRTVAGIGRGYSDDILHRARLSPYASLGSLEEAERRTLLLAVRGVLTEALEAERGGGEVSLPSLAITSPSMGATATPVRDAETTSGASPTSRTRSRTAPRARRAGRSSPTGGCPD